MLAVSMPNSDTLAALVETATKCLATALTSPPSDRFGEVGPIDVGNEPERHPAIAVVLECFVRHHRSEVGAPDADVDNIANPLARMTRPCAAPDPSGELGHLVSH